MSGHTTRGHVRFALPFSIGPAAVTRAEALASHLTSTLGRETKVVVAPSYEALARDILTGRVDAAWAPPFVCARIEAMGVRVLVRGVRNGASVYRAALLAKAESPLTAETLAGSRAVWSDRDSVGGYLLPMAWLKEKGFEPSKVFQRQEFTGNYRAALEAVLEGKADVTSVFAPVAREGHPNETGIGEIWPEKTSVFRILGFTEEAPNDGVAVAMGVSPALITELERTLLTLPSLPGGQLLLQECFHAERFELAPRTGYRALYRVALASL